MHYHYDDHVEVGVLEHKLHFTFHYISGFGIESLWNHPAK